MFERKTKTKKKQTTTLFSDKKEKLCITMEQHYKRKQCNTSQPIVYDQNEQQQHANEPAIIRVNKLNVCVCLCICK